MSIQVVDLHRLCMEVPGALDVLRAGCLRCRDRQWLIGLIKQNLGEAGYCAGECRVGASGVLSFFPRRIVAFFWADRSVRPTNCRKCGSRAGVPARRPAIPQVIYKSLGRRLTDFRRACSNAWNELKQWDLIISVDGIEWIRRF